MCLPRATQQVPNPMLLYTSDIHASPSHLFSMLSVAENEKVNCIIVGGDIVPHEISGSSAEDPIQAQALYLREVFIPAIRDFKRKRDIVIYLDLGNDDFAYSRPILEKENGGLIRLLHYSKYELNDWVDIIGYMNVPPTPFSIKDWEKPDCMDRPYARGQTISERGYISINGSLEPMVLDLSSHDTIEKDLERLSERIERPFIFVSHAPPYDTALDMIYNGLHVGSIAIRRFIEEWSKKGLLIVSFHGHIHESPNRTGSIYSKIENSLCINPGQGNGMASKFRYILFELSGERLLIDL